MELAGAGGHSLGWVIQTPKPERTPYSAIGGVRETVELLGLGLLPGSSAFKH